MSEMALPQAKEKPQPHLGSHYKDEDWGVALKAVMDAENDTVEAMKSVDQLTKKIFGCPLSQIDQGSVKMTLYGNFIAGICGFTWFLQHKFLPPPVWDFRCWEPAGFFTGVLWVPSVHPNLCYPLTPTLISPSQLDIIKKDLLDCVHKLKKRNRITGKPLTLEEMLNPIEEAVFSDSSYRFEEGDEEIVAKV